MGKKSTPNFAFSIQEESLSPIIVVPLINVKNKNARAYLLKFIIKSIHFQTFE